MSRKDGNIGGSLLLDSVWIYMPGILGLIVAYMIGSAEVFLFTMFVYVLVDSGHIYMTMLRTYFHTKLHKKQKWLIYTPIIIFLVICLWFFLG